MTPLSLLPLLAFAVAWSQPGALHSGLPVDGVDEALAAPRFHSARQGYSRDFPKGIARIYVGESEAAAAEWFGEMAERIAKQKPTPVEALGTEALQVGDKVLLVRDGNIALMVEAASGAPMWMDKLLAAISDEPGPPPIRPGLRVEGGRHIAQAPPDTRQLSWVGGQLAAESASLDAALQFDLPPRRLVAWDALGRATVADFDADGQIKATPPLRPQGTRSGTPGAATPEPTPGASP